MLYVVYGGDTYRASEFVRALGSATRQVVSQPEEIDLVLGNLVQASLFGSERLVVFRNLLRHFGPNQLKRIDPSLHQVVFWEEVTSLDYRLKIVEDLTQLAQVKEFKFLTKPSLQKWIQAQATRLQIKVQPDAGAQLYRLHGPNLWLLAQEVNKLAGYVAHREDKTVRLADVEAVSVSSVEQNVFEFVDAIGGRKFNRALSLLANLFDQQAQEKYLFGMVVRQFRLLLQAKGDCLEAKKPFIRRKMRQQARNWQLRQLQKVYFALARIDYLVKLGRSDLKTELTLFLAQLGDSSS